MIGCEMEVKHDAEKIWQLIKGVNFICNTEVVVGIPKESNGGHAGGMTNAELLYLHCNGSPANNIPARPVLQVGLNDSGTGEQIRNHLIAGMEIALLGDVDKAKSEYERAGMIGAAAVQGKFGAVPPPNAPSTIARKGSSAPLIDTGALKQAITYAVREK